MHEKILLIILNLLWAGAILGISLESWAKFKAKTLTRLVALDVGRTVFNAFQKAQIVFLIAIFILGIFSKLILSNWLIVFFIAMLLSAQIIFLYPILNKRINLIIQGENVEKSSAHSLYGILEILKLSALIFLSVNLLN